MQQLRYSVYRLRVAGIHDSCDILQLFLCYFCDFCDFYIAAVLFPGFREKNETPTNTRDYTVPTIFSLFI